MTLEEKRDATRIEHMHDVIDRIAVIMGALEKEDFLSDEMRCEALAHRLMQLGDLTLMRYNVREFWIIRIFQCIHSHPCWLILKRFRYLLLGFWRRLPRNAVIKTSLRGSLRNS